MANNHSTLTGLFTDIADAIREKTGGTESIVADEFPEAIAAIDTQEDLDPELATQDDLIAQIATALEGKTGASGDGAGVETITGSIDFCVPYNRYLFFYEDGNGIINTFDTRNSNSDGTPINFTIRKNSLIIFHCGAFASSTTSIAGVGLSSNVLESVNGSGIEILQNTTIGANSFIVDAICKVTDDFNLSWYEE